MTSPPRASHFGRFVPVCVVAVAGLAFGACGVEDRILEVGSGGGDLEAAVARFALANCDRYRVCAPTFIRSVTGTYDECLARSKSFNLWIGKLPGIKWSPQAFTDCAAAWNDVSCEEIFSPATIPACKVYGTLALGDACNFGDQCSSGFCKQAAYECGACAPQPDDGAPCQSSDDCGEAKWCMSDRTCRTPGGLNQPCSTTLSCQNGLTCSNGSCVVSPATAGASCTLGCDFYGKGLYCTSAGTCAPAIAKTSGQSCAEAGSYCESTGTCMSATCVNPSDNGGACDNLAGPYCEWPARCASGACRLPTSTALCGGA